MRKAFFLLLLLPVITLGQSYPATQFESSGGTQTPVYTDIVQWWKAIDAASPIVKMMEMGPTDAGYPLHLVMVSADRDFNMASLKKKGKVIIFINNGIHPGEPDGIDASMILVRDIVAKKQSLPANVVLGIIPVYNIGGCLNRSEHYRVDQNGPDAFGFRGNSENLDLNRDFIKCDSKEALTFTKIFHYLDPDIFADNHVSNGADYQHVMTLLTTQHNKLGGAMGNYLNDVLEPALYASMKAKGYDLVPYVNHYGETPDGGWQQYWDGPRYSSGYAALWGTFSFTPETHMLKPYKQRVASTQALMECLIGFASANAQKIRELRAGAKRLQATQDSFPIAWKPDRTKFRNIAFKGFEASHRKSEVSGLERLYYDRNKPYEKQVPFYDTYMDTLSIVKPQAYIIPQGWWKVIDRLQANGVAMRRLSTDTSLPVQWYRIENYNSSQRPYEGHHINTAIQVSRHSSTMRFRRGDYYIPLNGAANRFLMETLEPQGEDSYFAWNFFDPILGQKEGFSDYVFEETAAAYLKDHPDLQAALEARRKTDTAFAKSAYAQLDFVFRASPYFESAYLQYPVFSVIPAQSK